MKRVSAYHHYKNERSGRFSRIISAVLACIWQHKSGQALAGGVRDPSKKLCVSYVQALNQSNQYSKSSIA